MGYSLGCLLRQGVFPLIGQHAAGLPVPQCVHTLLPGGPVCALYSLAPGSWRCVEARPPHIPRGRSLPVARKRVSVITVDCIILNDDALQMIFCELILEFIPSINK